MGECIFSADRLSQGYFIEYKKVAGDAATEGIMAQGQNIPGRVITSSLNSTKFNQNTVAVSIK
jgi:hypothetical protein